MTSLRSMITSLTKTAMVTIARSVPGCRGCRQPSWHRWHGLPTMGWLRTERERERERCIPCQITELHHHCDLKPAGFTIGPQHIILLAGEQYLIAKVSYFLLVFFHFHQILLQLVPHVHQLCLLPSLLIFNSFNFTFDLLQHLFVFLQLHLKKLFLLTKISRLFSRVYKKGFYPLACGIFSGLFLDFTQCNCAIYRTEHCAIYRTQEEGIITYFNLLLSGYDGGSFFLELSQHFLDQA